MSNAEHLGFVQNIISRLADQSRTLKGWTVTLVATLLGLAIQQANATLCWIALYVILTLSGLDAYYLALERNYRNLYNRLVTAQTPSWNLDAGRLSPSAWLRAWLGPSVLIFYGSSALICLVTWALQSAYA